MTNKNSQPEIPAAFNSLEDAIIAAMFCQSLGFDSDLATKICKDYGCSIEMLKDIAKWHLQEQQARDLEHQNELKALQDRHSELSNLAEKQAIELAQVKEALAEFGKGIQAIKAEQKQAIKALKKNRKSVLRHLKRSTRKINIKLELAKKVEAVLRSASTSEASQQLKPSIYEYHRCVYLKHR